jgi:hypothetical protein
MEEAGRRKDSKKLFSIINKLAGKRAGKVIGMEPVKNLMGEVLSEKHDVLNRWKEHFENLLNRDDPADKERTIAEIQAVGDNINENCNMDTNNPAGRDMEVTVDEISKAINQLRRDKAPGVCNITAELLRDTGMSTKVWLHRVISTVWEQENIPQDWKKAIIIPIHKKGDRKECGNSRGISLLSVPGKVLTRVILNRIGKIINEKLRYN